MLCNANVLSCTHSGAHKWWFKTENDNSSASIGTIVITEQKAALSTVSDDQELAKSELVEQRNIVTSEPLYSARDAKRQNCKTMCWRRRLLATPPLLPRQQKTEDKIAVCRRKGFSYSSKLRSNCFIVITQLCTDGIILSNTEQSKTSLRRVGVGWVSKCYGYETWIKDRPGDRRC